MARIKSVSDSHTVCQACHSLAQDAGLSRQTIDKADQVGHCSTCLCFGQSRLSQKITITFVCHSCWVLADKAAIHGVSAFATLPQKHQLYPSSEEKYILVPIMMKLKITSLHLLL